MIFKNTKKQGDWGMGVAIAYFTSLGYTVCLPITDSQDYDLVVDIDTKLCKIQIKTTTFKQHGDVYTISLTTKGGNRTSKGTIKELNHSEIDYLFVVTGDNEKYLIPIEEIKTKHSLSLSKFTPL